MRCAALLDVCFVDEYSGLPLPGSGRDLPPATYMPGIGRAASRQVPAAAGVLYPQHRRLARGASFEHAVFLLGALWRGEELVIGACRDYGAVPVTDRWTMRTPRCIGCAPPTPTSGVAAVTRYHAPSQERWVS